MENCKIKYKIQLNEGPHIWKTVEIETDIEELEETDLSTLLIEKGFLNSWCNNGEYTVKSREIKKTKY